MSNVIIAFPNIADAPKTTLSGGSWVATLPLSNLQDEILGTVARSTNLLLASTQFDMTIDKPRAVRVVGLIAHTLSRESKYRLRSYDDAARTIVLTDTGWQDVWPAVYSISVLEWEDDPFWDGKPSSEELGSLNPSLIFRLPATSSSRWWRFEFDDQTNAAGYIDAGKLVLSSQWEPSRNMLPDASLGVIDRSELYEAIGGTTYASRRSVKRVATFSLLGLGKDEMLQKAYEIKRQAGKTQEVLFIFDADNATHLQRTAFLGRITDEDPVSIPHPPDCWRTSFKIEERL
ncbi:MAG: hypothetical protein ING73_17180 [Rhodocyclaceae bacterium]|nr:hypothetical protein [Rhodocyclaceae bacterium]